MGENQVPNAAQVTRCRMQRGETEICSHRLFLSPWECRTESDQVLCTNPLLKGRGSWGAGAPYRILFASLPSDHVL
jgi:hypothetical protein